MVDQIPASHDHVWFLGNKRINAPSSSTNAIALWNRKLHDTKRELCLNVLSSSSIRAVELEYTVEVGLVWFGEHSMHSGRIFYPRPVLSFSMYINFFFIFSFLGSIGKDQKQGTNIQKRGLKFFRNPNCMFSAPTSII